MLVSTDRRTKGAGTFVSLLVLASAGLGGVPGPAKASGAGPKVHPSCPNFQVGDSWTGRIETTLDGTTVHSSDLHYRVTKNDGSTIVIEQREASGAYSVTHTIRIDKDGKLVPVQDEAKSAGGATSVTKHTTAVADCPLPPVGSVRQSKALEAGKPPRPHKLEWTKVGSCTEPITVPAGTFDVVGYETEQSAKLPGGGGWSDPVTFTSYAAAGFGEIKFVSSRRTPSGTSISTWQLTGYDLAEDFSKKDFDLPTCGP